MRPRIRTAALAAATVAAALVAVPPSVAGPSSARACTPVHDSSATVVSHSWDIDDTQVRVTIVKRTKRKVTAKAVVAVNSRADVEAQGSATVDLCPDGMSTPFTRSALASRSAARPGQATRTSARVGASAAKAAAKAAARKAAVAQSAPAAYDSASAAAVDAAAAAALTAAENAANGGGNPTDRWSLGYYAGYEAADYPVGAIDWSGLTDVVMAFYLPAANGTLDGSLFQGSEAAGDALAGQLVAAAHAHGKRALASIGGADTRPAFLAAMTNHKAQLVQAIVALKNLGYDGIDIDWEPVEPSDQILLQQLGQTIRQAWPDAVLTATFYAVNVNFIPDLSGMDGIATAYDFISVQTYGMAGAYEGWKSWHSSALDGETDSTPTSVDSSVQAYLDAGVPADKLGVGIGAYGLCYTAPVTAPDQQLNGSTIAKADYDLQFRAIRNTYQPAMNRSYDGGAQAPYLSGSKNGCTYITYEDEQSTAAKLAYLESKGLAGVIMWTINQQYLPGAGEKNPLLHTIATDWLG